MAPRFAAERIAARSVSVIIGISSWRGSFSSEYQASRPDLFFAILPRTASSLSAFERVFGAICFALSMPSRASLRSLNRIETFFEPTHKLSYQKDRPMTRRTGKAVWLGKSIAERPGILGSVSAVFVFLAAFL